MGNKWEVVAWIYDDERDEYRNETVYSGDYLMRAIWQVVKAKRNSGCVRLVWRG